ncbi:Beta-taxilin [Dissostichus eleginoides]|uniref:Beta-taxilin n=1 Tax=Dissostichus eleginoides TaxID=100907 RepID=A0AAD9C066_DISEL|nr:Beta-taxilin [Dissostichus eleginoides]
MRQRGYQFVEGFLCPISSVKGHVPRVLTLVTSLASSLPGDPGPGVFITTPPPNSPLNPPNIALPMEENKTPPSLPPAVPWPAYMY